MVVAISKVTFTDETQQSEAVLMQYHLGKVSHFFIYVIIEVKNLEISIY